MTPDHPTSGPGNWYDGQDFKGGFSNDPGVMQRAINNQVMPLAGAGAPNLVTNSGNANPYNAYHLGFIVYAPEDTGNVFHWYYEGSDITTGAGLSLSGRTTNGSPVVTGISTTALLVGGGPGLGATVAGTGSPASTYIKVDSSSQITLSNSATAIGSPALTFQNPQLQHEEGALRSNISIIGRYKDGREMALRGDDFLGNRHAAFVPLMHNYP